MTHKENFTSHEWQSVLEATALVGIGIINADKTNLLEIIKELVAYSSGLIQAETEYKSNILLQNIIEELRNDVDKHLHKLQAKALRNNSQSEILDLLDDAIEILRNRAAELDLATYKHFLLSLAEKIANASGEGTLGFLSNAVSEQEKKFLEEIKIRLV